MDDPDDIAAWQRIGPGLTTSGRLLPGDPARLRALGVARVINLALEDSPGALADEDMLMARHGIDYLHIPVPFDAPGEAHYAAFAAAMDAAPDAVTHVHCIANWRVSAFLNRWHRARGMDPAKADALMHQQWDPATSDHRDAPAWAAFLAQG